MVILKKRRPLSQPASRPAARHTNGVSTSKYQFCPLEASEYISKLPDRVSVYRCLSRQVIGDPTKHVYIQNQVLDHYLRDFLSHDPRYRTFESMFFEQDGRRYAFFQLLCIPDIVLCPCNVDRDRLILRDAVMSVITKALGIRLVTFDSRNKSRLLADVGVAGHPECHIKFAESDPGQVSGSCLHKAVSLLPDPTGSNLISYMADLKSKSVCLGEEERRAQKLADIREIWYYLKHYYDEEPDIDGYEPHFCGYNEYNKVSDLYATFDVKVTSSPY